MCVAVRHPPPSFSPPHPQWNTIKDDFEQYPKWRQLVWDQGAPHMQVSLSSAHGQGRGAADLNGQGEALPTYHSLAL